MTPHTITDADDGIRLDRWFKRHHPQITHGLLEKMLRKGDIRLDGKKAKSSDRVQAGQAITGRIPDSGAGSQREKKSANPEPRVLNPNDVQMMKDIVLYQDAQVIVVNKPAGLAVQGGNKITRSLDGMLGALAGEQGRPKLTHRLDRDTSGVLVLARSSKDANTLMKLFSSRKVEKTYWALVNKCPLELRGTIDLPLLKKDSPKASGYASGPEGRDYEIMQVDEEEGQKAVTEYRVIEALARKFALMELKPLTGRTHQLRVHMQAIGCPIVGDHKYGGATTDAEGLGVANVLHLHARRIVFPLPNGKKIDIAAPLPPHMKKSFEALGLDVPKK